MNLKEKLAGLDRFHPTTIKKKKTFPDQKYADLLPGEKINTEAGECWRIRKIYNLDFKHGPFQICDFLHNNPENLKLIVKNRDITPLVLDKFIFIDTETTGLSGGVGTLAFLIGVGYFDKNRFLIDQFFMRDFNEERGVLKNILELLEQIPRQDGAVVSFNGKSYDLPLVGNRSIFHKFIRHLPPFAHIDLLHPSRRLWKKSLPDCALGTLEKKILQIQRQNDVPGYMIPEIYFQYLRSRDPRPLIPVFYHNRMDILSLVSILTIMLKLYSSKVTQQNIPVDWLAMGNVYEDIKKYEEGIDFYQNLLQKDITIEDQKDTILRLAGIFKKQKNYKAAVKYWKQSLNLPGFSIEPYEELAKVYEHKIPDLHLAGNYTQKALDNVRLLEQLNQNYDFREQKKNLLYRLDRIRRKSTNQT